MDSPTGTTFQHIEAYFTSLETFLSSSLNGVTPDLPQVREIVYRLWVDLTRFGPPSLPQLPGLGSFEVPPVPPPPPSLPSSSWTDDILDWISENKAMAASVAAGAVGTSLLVGYGLSHWKQYATLARKREASKDRREVVVVFGADHPVGLPLVLGLEAQGYIVIASVSNQAAIEPIESKAKGYVRVLILDPSEPSTVPYFLRSLQTTLSLRFPTTSHGDPYLSSTASLTIRPYIQSLISLLPLFPSQNPSPIEALSLTDSYLPNLMRSHITPLRVIQSLLPLFRRSPRALAEGPIRKSIVVCVPAIAARVGIAFGGLETMATAATVRGVEVLRRELKACAAQNSKEGVVAPKVVLVEVGALTTKRSGRSATATPDPAKITQSWSPSERNAYAAALMANLDLAHTSPRKPAPVSAFVNAIVGVVSNGTRGPGYGYGYRTEFTLAGTGRFFLAACGRIHTWIRGERFGVGSGAATYSLASYLPPRILDFLLHIPQAITASIESMRTARQNTPLERPGSELMRYSSLERTQRLIQDTPNRPGGKASSAATGGSEIESSDAASEGDVESLGASEPGVGLTDSWVSLKENNSETQSTQGQ